MQRFDQLAPPGISSPLSHSYRVYVVAFVAIWLVVLAICAFGLFGFGPPSPTQISHARAEMCKATS